MRKEATFGLSWISEALEPPEREAGTRPAATPVRLTPNGAGRALGGCMHHSWSHMKPAQGKKPILTQGQNLFIKHIPVSWTTWEILMSNHIM